MSLLLRPFRQARNLKNSLYLLNARNGSYDLTPQKAPDGTPYLAKRLGDEVGPLPRIAGQDEFGETKYWRNIYILLGPLPCIFMYLYCEYFGEDIHPTREYYKGYDHMAIRTKENFPWGTTKTLFHNKWTNRLPSGWEEMTPEEMAEIEKHHGGHHKEGH